MYPYKEDSRESKMGEEGEVVGMCVRERGQRREPGERESREMHVMDVSKGGERWKERGGGLNMYVDREDERERERERESKRE